MTYAHWRDLIARMDKDPRLCAVGWEALRRFLHG